MTLPLPREIKPELIEPGDTISVRLPTDNGLTVSHEGTVSEIKDYAGGRHFHTVEGTRIAVYVPGRYNRSKFTLVKREPQSHPQLW